MSNIGESKKRASKTRYTLDASDLIKTPVPVNHFFADLIGVVLLKIMFSFTQIHILQVLEILFDLSDFLFIDDTSGFRPE
jgi:hypothetical protein